MSIPVSLTPGTLPYTCWPETPQELNVDIVTRIIAVLNVEFVGLYVSATTPPVDQRDKVWFNTNDYQLYYWTPVIGSWARKNPWLTPSGIRLPWALPEADVVSFDHGQAGVVGPASGPMWEVDHNWDGRTFRGAGTVPGSDPAVTVTNDVNGGAAQVALTAAQVGPHQHIVPACAIQANTTDPAPTGSPATVQYGIGKTQGTGRVIDSTSGDWERAFPLTSENQEEADQEDVPILSPYRGGYFIKRTARIYILP